jgi:putative flippase GtrA
MVEALGVPVLPGQVASLALTTAATYVVHRRFTFGDFRGTPKLAGPVPGRSARWPM